MATIINKRDQKLIINLLGGRNLELPEKVTIDIPDSDLASPHLQALRDKGDILVLKTQPQKKDKPENIKKSDSGKNPNANLEESNKVAPKAETSHTDTHRKTTSKKEV